MQRTVTGFFSVLVLYHVDALQVDFVQHELVK